MKDFLGGLGMVGCSIKVSPVYTENNVQMFPFPVTVDPHTGAIQDAGGDATITLNVKSGGTGHAAPSASPSN